jgi:transglutaminase/protease-like cytokinesis protein 3
MYTKLHTPSSICGGMVQHIGPYYGVPVEVDEKNNVKRRIQKEKKKKEGKKGKVKEKEDKEQKGKEKRKKGEKEKSKEIKKKINKKEDSVIPPPLELTTTSSSFSSSDFSSSFSSTSSSDSSSSDSFSSDSDFSSSSDSSSSYPLKHLPKQKKVELMNFQEGFSTIRVEKFGQLSELKEKVRIREERGKKKRKL